MPHHFISIEQAQKDLLACAAFLGERIRSGNGHAEAMKSIVPRFLARGEVDLAAELANAVDDPFSRDKLLIAVAIKCAELDDDEYALQLADAIEDQGMQAEALERVALIEAGKGNTDKAAEIAGSMLHPEYVFAGIAVHQAANGDQTAADTTLGRIEYANARVSALQQIARAHINAKELDKAVETLEKAVTAASEIEHDEEKIRSLCDLGTLFTEAGDKNRSIETFEQAQTEADVLDNIHRDFFLVNCALGFLYAGNGDLADGALDLVADKTQMASALLGFARESWEKGEKDEALDTIEESYAILKSQRDIETRDSRARNALMASIAVQFAGFGKDDRATEIALENADHDDRMAAIGQIAQVLTMRHEDELARQTVNLIEEDANRLFALINLSEAKKNLGEETQSVKFLDEAAELVETVPQLAARSSVLNEIAVRYAEHGEMDKARALAFQNFETIAEIRDESSQASALASMSNTFTTVGGEMTDPVKQIVDNLIREADRPT